MNSLEGLLYGLELALDPSLLIAAFVGALVGTVVGILPGIGAVAGAAILLPLTFMYEPAVGLVVVAAIYLGSQFGSSITSVLVNIPGDSQSIVATFDGYPLAKKGRAGAAIAIMVSGSFIAGLVGMAVVLLTIPIISPIAINFGPPELFALTAGGLIALARIAGGSMASGLFPTVIGVALGTVGTEPAIGYDRFTFGSMDLTLGISLVTVAVGLYAISEVLYMIEDGPPKASGSVRLRDLKPSRRELREAVSPWFRGSLIGYGFGIIPGPSATLATFSSYKVEQAVAKDKSKFGRGAVAGLAGPEAANSSATVGSLLPVLLLGLPFSATLALMIAAMQVHGVQPGPMLIVDNPDVFWAVIGAVVIANLMLVVINVPLIGVWAKALQTPPRILIPTIILLGAIGTYSLNNNLIDVRLMVILGFIGYFLRKSGFSLASLLVGVILGPLVEQYLVEGLFLGGGDIWYFVSTPAALIIWLLVAGLVLSGVIKAIVSGKRRRKAMKEPSR